jgi:hypothetical protein
MPVAGARKRPKTAANHVAATILAVQRWCSGQRRQRAQGGSMKFHVEKRGSGFRIRIDSLVGREQEVLEAIRECRKRSAWACPSGECVNIGTMDAKADEGAVLLTLAPRPGEELSEPAIEECLRYMLGQSIRP